MVKYILDFLFPGDAINYHSIYFQCRTAWQLFTTQQGYLVQYQSRQKEACAKQYFTNTFCIGYICFAFFTDSFSPEVLSALKEAKMWHHLFPF